VSTGHVSSEKWLIYIKAKMGKNATWAQCMTASFAQFVTLFD